MNQHAGAGIHQLTGHTGGRGNGAGHQPSQRLLGYLFAGMFAQRVGNLVPHDGGQLIVCELELAHDAGVHANLAARGAESVDLVRVKHIDFPVPLQRIGAENTNLRNQILADIAHALRQGRIVVELLLAACISRQLLKTFGCLGIDGVAGDDQQLAAVQANRTTAGGVGAALDEQRSEQQACPAQQGGGGLPDHV